MGHFPNKICFRWSIQRLAAKGARFGVQWRASAGCQRSGGVDCGGRLEYLFLQFGSR